MSSLSNFAGKTLLITGGTGSFGNAVLRRFLDSEIKEIRIFSRDEKKQDDMRHNLPSEKLKFFIGDVRDRASLDPAMVGVDYVFTAAALKQVPSCEFFPEQAVATNVTGTINTLDSAIAHGVKNVLVLSTDKAAYPINAMGLSKALMEKIAVAKARQLGPSAGTTICCVRYGNMLGSRGSVLPLWISQIKRGEPITMTNPQMKRFISTLDEAVDLVLYAFENGQGGDLFVQKSPATTMENLAQVLKEIYGKIDPKFAGTPIKTIGLRHGEKFSEVLLTSEEMAIAQDLGDYFRVPADMRGLGYDKNFAGTPEKIVPVAPYDCQHCEQLDAAGTREMLMKLRIIREDLGLVEREHPVEIHCE